MNRRETLKFMLGGAALVGVSGLAGGVATAQQKPFTLPPLGYPYEALEPHIDTATMRIHHSAHHNACVNNLNTIAEKWPELGTRPVEEILSNLSVVPEASRTGVRNNLGGHWNHVYFWNLMTPGGAKAPTADVAAAINGTFGDLDKMKGSRAGAFRLGLGVAWRRQGQEADRVQHRQPGQPARLRGRQGDPRHRGVGARLLPQAPVQARRLRRRLVEHRELGQGRGQFQEGDGVAAGHMKGMTLAKRVGRIELPRRHADARR